MFEIVLEVDGQDVSAHCRYRGSSTKPRVIGTLATIEGFTKKVGTAIRVGVKFDEKLLAQAHALHEALFHDEILSVFASIEATKPPLVRLIIEDSRLQEVPWEALCKPGTSEDFIAKGTRFSVARSISSDSVATRPIENALRLLVIAPQDHEAGLQSLRIALSDPIEHGAVEWLDPIRGQRATTFRIFDPFPPIAPSASGISKRVSKSPCSKPTLHCFVVPFPLTGKPFSQAIRPVVCTFSIGTGEIFNRGDE